MNLSLSAIAYHSPSESRQKPREHTYLDTRVITSQTKRSRRSASTTAENRLRTKTRLVALAREVEVLELAEKLERCHSQVAVLTCGQHVSKVIPNYTCEFRLCPHCARRRSRKHLSNYLPKVWAFARSHRVTPVLLTLTQAHRAETLEQSVERLKASFRKLSRRGFWLKHFRGGLWSVEVTKDKDGLYHTHLHLFAFRSKFFDVGLLRSEWLAVTGDSVVVHLERISEDVESGLREVLKYVAKPLDIKRFRFTADNLRDFLDVKNMRFFGTFGEFQKACSYAEKVKEYKKKLKANHTVLTEAPPECPQSLRSFISVYLSELAKVADDGEGDLVEGCACPKCEQPLFEVRLSDDALPDFLRKVEVSARSGSPPGRKDKLRQN